MDSSAHESPAGDSQAGQTMGPFDSSSNADLAATAHDQDDQNAEKLSGGVTVYSPSAPVSASLNPRSCVTCRRRKVRCDKHMPCSNCKRAQIPCVFPAPGRAPRRPRPRDPNAPPKQPSSERELELMKRLRKLEGIVEELSGQVEVETARRHSSSTSNSPDAQGPASTSGGAAHTDAALGGSRNSAQGRCLPGLDSSKSSPGPSRLISSLDSALGQFPTASGPMDEGNKEYGRFVVHQVGKGRYVSSGFWSKINDELDAIRAEAHGWTDDDLDESDEETKPDVAALDDHTRADHQSFLFGFRSADADLRPLHPLPSQIPFLWSIYQENVDPVFKILHMPSMNKLIRDVRQDPDVLTPATEALMFSIYYAAITSMEEDDVKTNFGTDKASLLSRYRFATEQALAKADFLISSDIVTCQALLLFLQLVLRHDDTRFAWTLTGLAWRIAQSLGLHRDGTHFSQLMPFEVEMRRRLFWAICMLDLRTAEDQGTDLVVIDRFFDTQIPLNINDADISPESSQMPEAREGTTDMSISLIRCELCALGRRMHVASSVSASVCPRYPVESLEERELLLRDLYVRLETTHLRDSSAELNPMFWVAANLMRVMVAKLTLIIYQPVIFDRSGSDTLSVERRQRLIAAAVEIFECHERLNSDPRSKQWRWLFHTYMQWQAIGYLLLECSYQPWTALMERAWTAVSGALDIAKAVDLPRMSGHLGLWLPFRKLVAKCRRHRQYEIARLRADPQAALQLDLDDDGEPAPSTFDAIAGSIKSAVARERWRKLVNLPPRKAGAPLIRPNPLPADGTTASPLGNALPSSLDGQARLAQPSGNGRDRSGEDAIAIVDEAMSDPTFQPDQFMAVAWSNPASINIAPDEILGLPATAASAPFADMSSRQNDLPPPLSRAIDDNPPPWMWSAEDTTQTGATTSRPADPSTILTDITLDDADMSMDEGVDWQNWQESLRAFEIAGAGRGLANGIWGNGT